MTTIWLPYVTNATTIVGGTGEPSGMAALLYDTMRHDPLQKRPTCVWSVPLAHAAQSHCEDMVRRGYFSHTSPEGIWPNKRARLAGYKLADFEDDKNNIESIGGGYKTVDEVWTGWLFSPLHRLHVLGEESYASQVNVGTGYFMMVDAPLFDVCWAVVSAPVELTI
jgi:hypothetical protein